MAKKTFSRRAEILKQVLEWINRDEYSDYGECMVFGNQSIIEEEEDEIEEEEKKATQKPKDPGSEILEMINRFVADIQNREARHYVRERTSLSKPDPLTQEQKWELFKKHVDTLSPEAKAVWGKGLEEHTQKGSEETENTDQQEASATDDPNELADRYYSRELLAKLERIVRLASLLDRVETPKIPSESVEVYFEEAHRCFLYGFPIATAVLCRAILEARLLELQHILDPDEELKRKKASSYLKALINKAAQEGLLEDARPLLGRKNSPHWAEEIIDAGNWAVHKLNKFNQRYGGDQGSNRLHDLLTITRKALIQLLSEKKG